MDRNLKIVPMNGDCTNWSMMLKVCERIKENSEDYDKCMDEHKILEAGKSLNYYLGLVFAYGMLTGRQVGARNIDEEIAELKEIIKKEETNGNARH